MAAITERTPWASGVATRGVAAVIFWWLVATTWFHWLTVIFLIGAVISTALVALFLAGWRRDHAKAG